ncbi:MAG: response regulator transcription factor [Thermomicrobiales bacterium]
MFGIILAQVIEARTQIMRFRAAANRIDDGFLVMIVMSNPASVLIVEDDECIAALIADALREETDVRPFILHNGNDAIRFLAEQPIDFLILDYQLPGANGLAVYDAIRQNPRTRHTPVLFITANDKRAEFQRRSLTYMRKPFNLFELLATVEERLGQPHDSAAST